MENDIQLQCERQFVHINVGINDPMKDLKLKGVISCLSGDDCIIFISKTKDRTNPNKIRIGFSFNKTLKKLLLYIGN